MVRPVPPSDNRTRESSRQNRVGENSVRDGAPRRGAAGGETQRAHRAGRSAAMSLRRMLGRGPLGNAGWFSVCSCGECPERDAKHPPGRSGRSVWLCVAKMRDGDETGHIRSRTRGPSAFTPCRAIRPEIERIGKKNGQIAAILSLGGGQSLATPSFRVFFPTKRRRSGILLQKGATAPQRHDRRRRTPDRPRKRGAPP